MPCRLVREGILSSERVNKLGLEAEVFFRRLLSVVDDYGRFFAHPALLRAALYPLRLDILVDSQMPPLMQEVEAAGLVHTYTVDGKPYVQVLRFRQQLRAHKSKYPAPPYECEASAQQLLSNGEATAHLGGGEGEVVDVCEGEGGGVAKRAKKSARPLAKAQTPAATPPMQVQIAVQLREQGVNITSAHPLAQAWAARGLTMAQAMEALAIARLRKPQGRIAANYLAPIVEEVLSPPVQPRAGARSGAPPAWWSSEPATLAKGRELGLNAHPGEGMHEYRARLSAAIAGARAAPPAGAAPTIPSPSGAAEGSLRSSGAPTGVPHAGEGLGRGSA